MPSSKKPVEAKPEESDAPPDHSDLSRGAVRHFLDLPIDLTVELAHKSFKVREILEWEVDSVIQMDQSAGENVDLRLNGVAVGNGEIVVIEDMMGLRVTDLKTRAADLPVETQGTKT